MILGKELFEWEKEFPIIEGLVNLEESVWMNPSKKCSKEALHNSDLGIKNILDAEERLKRFAPYIAKAFPETVKDNGIIESETIFIDFMKELIVERGKLMLKCDNELPISGSIKARGGIYEVLKFAEELAINEGMLSHMDDYSIISTDKFKRLFQNYEVAVGSTGNLGLSIGIISAKLGFKTSVYMSTDAKKWKKDLLREKGVTVVECEDDYSVAVAEGRKKAESNTKCYFIDDENSETLFLGYAVAALRLKNQLEKQEVVVNSNNPLFVYLPCGVGGGPGGVAFGLKVIFGDNVHCFFAEPVNSPCMLLGMATKLHNKVSVQDFGIDNKTEADGLAVGRASGFVGGIMENLISGCFTVKDNRLFEYLALLTDLEKIKLEPSALAGFLGPQIITKTKEGKDYLLKENITDIDSITHLLWATGGNMVPEDIQMESYEKGVKIITKA